MKQSSKTAEEKDARVKLLREVLAKANASTMTEAEARRRERVAKAALAELDLGERRGELIEVAAVAEEWGIRGRQVRDALLALPDRIAQRSGANAAQAREIRELLMAEIRRALTVLGEEVKAAKF